LSAFSRLPTVNLRTIVLNEVSLSSELLSSLLNSVTESCLEVFTFSHPDKEMFSSRTNKDISSSFMKFVQKCDSLQSLTLSHGFPEQIISRILDAIAQCNRGSHLRHLDISGNNLGNPGMYLVESVIYAVPRLLSLNVDYNHTDYMGFQVLLHALQEIPDSMLCELVIQQDMMVDELSHPEHAVMCMKVSTTITEILSRKLLKNVQELLSVPESLQPLLYHLTGNIAPADMEQRIGSNFVFCPEDVLCWSSCLPYQCLRSRTVEQPPPRADVVDDDTHRRLPNLSHITTTAGDYMKSFKGFFHKH